MQASTAHTHADDRAAVERPELAAQLLALWRSVMAGNGVGAYAIFEELDLTLTQVKALVALSAQELTVKELAERLGLSLPGASRAADALVARELVGRREGPHDRRMNRLRCTDSGAQALTRLDEARLAGLERFTATIAPADADLLSDALEPILAAIDAQKDQP
jgi:DNA-binding MarR family transcriptional regulator